MISPNGLEQPILMNVGQVITIIGSLLGAIVSISVVALKLLMKKFDKIDERFDRIEKNFDLKLDLKISTLEKRLDARISDLESYIEEMDSCIGGSFVKVFNKIDAMDNKIEDIKYDVQALKESILVLETENRIIFGGYSSDVPNKRSESAKEMWKKRKSRKLLGHNSNPE